MPEHGEGRNIELVLGQKEHRPAEKGGSEKQARVAKQLLPNAMGTETAFDPTGNQPPKPEQA